MNIPSNNNQTTQQTPTKCLPLANIYALPESEDSGKASYYPARGEHHE